MHLYFRYGTIVVRYVKQLQHAMDKDDRRAWISLHGWVEAHLLV